MPSISTIPAHPIPGKPFKLTASASAGGNAVRLWVTSAPPGSDYRKQLDKTKATRIKFAELEVGRPTDVTLDKGGGFVLELEELQRGTGFTGGYGGDPRGAPSVAILATTTATLYVASPINCQLGYGQHTATLRLFVSAGDILATSVEQHGLATPSIDLGSQASAQARTAAESSSVVEQLAELVGPATTALGSPAAAIANLVEAYEDHRDEDNVHAAPDEANNVNTSSFGANLTSISGQRDALSALRLALSRHIRNVNPDSTTQDTGNAAPDYHNGISWSALPLDQIAPTDDPLTIQLALADTWRAFAAHRVNDVHESRDISNAADELAPLPELHRRFIAQLASVSPTTPPNGHSAIALLASAAGFKDS